MIELSCASLVGGMNGPEGEGVNIRLPHPPSGHPKKPPPAANRSHPTSQCRATRRKLVGVDCVSDDSAEDTARRGADDRALHLVTTRHCTDRRATDGTDHRVTLRVADRL